MEIENVMKSLLSINNFSENGTTPLSEKKMNMKHYFELEKVLKLSEYKATFLTHDGHPLSFAPFSDWKQSQSFQKAPSWFQSHQKVKHNRTQEYHEASFEKVLTSLTALNILLYTMYGPYYLLNQFDAEGVSCLVSDNAVVFQRIPPYHYSLIRITKYAQFNESESYDPNAQGFVPYW
jgi:hypothetical protein